MDLNRRRIALRDDDGPGATTRRRAAKVREILETRGWRMRSSTSSLRNGSITSRDLVNVGYRKDQLAVFEDASVSARRR